MAQQKTWHERIAEAEKIGRFTAEDKRLAGNWVTCACGEQDKELNSFSLFDASGSIEYRCKGPWDYELRKLGQQFTQVVDFNRPESARIILARIQARATFLLAEMSRAKQESGDYGNSTTTQAAH